jgi:predicted dienelactone hydrolase
MRGPIFILPVVLGKKGLYMGVKRYLFFFPAVAAIFILVSCSGGTSINLNDGPMPPLQDAQSTDPDPDAGVSDAAEEDSGETDAGYGPDGSNGWDSGQHIDAGGADAAHDASADAGLKDAGDAGADGGTDAGQMAEYPPDKWGKYAVGYYKQNLYDKDRSFRYVPVHIWYPALAPGAVKVNYLVDFLDIMNGNAYENVPAARPDGPFPVILFSHGFKGIAYQSYSFTEYLASHGFVVVAPNHQGNTLFDFTSKDEDVAKVTMLRPGDVGFAFKSAETFGKTAGHVLEGVVDSSLVAATGHSFGAFTAIIVAGSEADMDRAKQACANGVEADIFCDYVPYYAPGTMLKMDPRIGGLKVMVDLAPGGYNAMFDDNLAKVYVPSLTMGGTEDTTCPLDIETRPIFNGMAKPKALAEITGASHMTFTDVCSNALLKGIIGDMCTMSINSKRAFEIINTLSTAYIRRHLLGETAMDTWLSPGYIGKNLGEVKWVEDK